MNSVTQKHNFGCGIACIAFIVKINYSKVLSHLSFTQAENTGFNCQELVQVLSKFNHIYLYKYLKPKLKRKIYQNGIIVFIKRSTKYPSGHYLTYSDGQWMDPWINFLKSENVNQAKSGFIKRLPGTPIYALFPLLPS